MEKLKGQFNIDKNLGYYTLATLAILALNIVLIFSIK